MAALSDTATLGKDLFVSFKIKYISTYEPVILVLNIYSREMKTYLFPCKGLYTTVLSSFIHNSQQLEIALTEQINML